MNSKRLNALRPAEATAASEKNETEQKRASVEELLLIAKKISSQIQKPWVEHGVLLYDENGVPK